MMMMCPSLTVVVQPGMSFVQNGTKQATTPTHVCATLHLTASPHLRS